MDEKELPLGLGMALAQNEPAMERFTALSETQKQAVVSEAHQVHSKKEMQRLVEDIGRSEG